MAAESKEELKNMMREVIKEQMAEMASSSAGYQNPPGTKAAAQKKAPKTEFDMTRQMGPDQRDPRLQKETWPCFGTHIKIWVPIATASGRNAPLAVSA